MELPAPPHCNSWVGNGHAASTGSKRKVHTLNPIESYALGQIANIATAKIVCGCGALLDVKADKRRREQHLLTKGHKKLSLIHI